MDVALAVTPRHDQRVNLTESAYEVDANLSYPDSLFFDSLVSAHEKSLLNQEAFQAADPC